MTFTFEGIDYRIVFQYDWSNKDQVGEPDPFAHREMTRCMIFKLPYAMGETPFCQGTVDRHFGGRAFAR